MTVITRQQIRNYGYRTLAEALAGTEAAFADLMNQRAPEIGLTNSHFANSLQVSLSAVTYARTMRILWILGLAALVYGALGVPGLDSSRVSAAVAGRTAALGGSGRSASEPRRGSRRTERRA